MQAKRKIEAKSVRDDIRAGLSNFQLMEKYSLSAKGLLSAFQKLITQQIIEEAELAGRMPIFDDTVDIDHAREFPRCYPALGLPIYDKASRDGEYHVLDLTEKGVQIVGIEAHVNDTKTLVIKAEGLDESIKPCSFDAECRWLKGDSGEGQSIAGFEITYISGQDLERLSQIIKLLTFCDE